eukprot:TRINITY_DN998_c0_g1_i14.p1 TRINITY_DN998_c0_g1~~TRINITY_DN998_c0_g1_i14.p1  ORF type:complete len:334 (+),score=-11.49 TRINITY_DN998_c0_g1_i14:868-1869(+)
MSDQFYSRVNFKFQVFLTFFCFSCNCTTLSFTNLKNSCLLIGNFKVNLLITCDTNRLWTQVEADKKVPSESLPRGGPLSGIYDYLSFYISSINHSGKFYDYNRLWTQVEAGKKVPSDSLPRGGPLSGIYDYLSFYISSINHSGKFYDYNRLWTQVEAGKKVPSDSLPRGGPFGIYDYLIYFISSINHFGKFYAYNITADFYAYNITADFYAAGLNFYKIIMLKYIFKKLNFTIGQLLICEMQTCTCMLHYFILLYFNYKLNKSAHKFFVIQFLRILTEFIQQQSITYTFIFLRQQSRIKEIKFFASTILEMYYFCWKCTIFFSCSNLYYVRFY